MMGYKYIKGFGNDFTVQLGYATEHYMPVNDVVRYVFFISSRSEEQYRERKEAIRSSLDRYYKEITPVWSCVAQSPLDGSELTVEIQFIDDRKEYSHTSKSYLGMPYKVTESPLCRKLYLGGITSGAGKKFREGCDEVFDTIEKIFELENMPPSSIIRQWNYIAGITQTENGSQHYQDFNNARSAFYEKDEWVAGYPAATGIGSSHGGVIIDLEAIVPKEGGNISIKRIDNKLQVSAFAYSEGVLAESGQGGKTTPKFERAKAVVEEGKCVVHISGTAAIRGEESLEGVGVERQTYTTLENMEYLITKEALQTSGVDAEKDAAITMLRVYIKHAADKDAVSRIVTQRYPDVPAIYLLADVCRDNLLVEIEGVAEIR